MTTSHNPITMAAYTTWISKKMKNVKVQRNAAIDTGLFAPLTVHLATNGEALRRENEKLLEQVKYLTTSRNNAVLDNMSLQEELDDSRFAADNLQQAQIFWNNRYYAVNQKYKKAKRYAIWLERKARMSGRQYPPSFLRSEYLQEQDDEEEDSAVSDTEEEVLE